MANVNKGVWAINKNGSLTKCVSSEEDRGRGRCNHIKHQLPGQSDADFIKSMDYKLISQEGAEEVDTNADAEAEENRITQNRIDEMAIRIDEIAGVKVTAENMNDVLLTLSPDKIQKITAIGFEAAPEFELSISDEHYGEAVLDNKLYFTDLPEYGIAGKSTALTQMFEKVGEVPGYRAAVVIEGNYRDGLTQAEYFAKSFSARAASIAKSISVAGPGYCQRLSLFALSDIQVVDDCKGSHDEGILGCSHANGTCVKCAAKDGVELKAGDSIGPRISTNISENLVQLEMKKFHTGGKKEDQKREVIMATLNAWVTSPIIIKARKEDTTQGRRRVLFEGLRDEYAKNNISIDDYNLKIMAKQLTSFKRSAKEDIRWVKKDELASIVSVKAAGGALNPFKSAELQSPYAKLTNPTKFEIGESVIADMFL